MIIAVGAEHNTGHTNLSLSTCGQGRWMFVTSRAGRVFMMTCQGLCSQSSQYLETNMINISKCHPPYNDSEQPVLAMYSFVFVLGLPANILTLWLTLLQIYRKNVLAVYLFSLSFSEILYIGTLPLWILYVRNGHRWIWGPLSCKITGYIFFNNIYMSILLLCCISVDRFLAVEYSLESRGVRRQRIAISVSLVLFIVVGLIHSTVFMLNDGVQTEEQTTCFESLPMPSITAQFYYARFIIGFLLPLFILIYTNYNINRRIETSNSFTGHQKAKVKYLAIAIITIFMICFAPYHIVLLIRAINFSLNPTNTCGFEEDVYTLYAAFLCLATMNSIADPFIYVLVSENVRKDICKGLRGWSRQLSVTLRSDNSNCPHISNSRDQHGEDKDINPRHC
ncbi:probable G-protein coupled receptor 132 isoform X2 [Bombina bombina]|uniref:probable G-protein coupled receptor 132 isoform X2 n=1 Tax=Bombina bombina TaxID=8345 RepID=UPI00235A4921|nr:probable G-protein coupled receptor 132 isoform X2 [Bombina bombina]